MKIRASIILIHYRNVNYTIRCISSILRSKTKFTFEVVIIDNSNQVVDIRRLKGLASENKKIHFYKNKSENTGFSSGIAYGLQHAKNEYLVILDNDTVVMNNWLDGLLYPFLKLNKVGITTSNIIDPADNQYTILGGVVNILGYSYPNKVPVNSFESTEKQKLFYGITSWCIKKEMLKKIGIDTSFQFFSDDADIGFKIKSLGLDVIPANNSCVIHYKSEKDEKNIQKNKNKILIFHRDYLIFSFKNLLFYHFCIFFISFIFIKGIFLSKRLFINHDITILYDIEGIFAFFAKSNNLLIRKKSNTNIRSISYITLLKQFSKKLYVGSMNFR